MPFLNLKEIKPFGTTKCHIPKTLFSGGRCQIFTEADRTELDLVDLDDGWLAGFIGLLTRIVRKMGGKK